MQKIWIIPHKSVEKCDLPKEIIYIPKISDIGDLLSGDFLFFFEKNPRPTIRKLLESHDTSIIL